MAAKPRAETRLLPGAPTLAQWAWAEIMLVQAMVAAVTPNMRRVSLCADHCEEAWRVRVVLRTDHANDRQLAAEITDDFTAFLMDCKDELGAAYDWAVSLEVTVSDGMLGDVDHRRERILLQWAGG